MIRHTLLLIFCAFTFFAQAQADTTQQKNTDDGAIPTVTTDVTSVDQESSDQGAASILGASRDVFAGPAIFRFLNTGFRFRGYTAGNFVTVLNGVLFNDVEAGQTIWGTYSGLNEVTRGRRTTVGMAASTDAFGGIGAVYNIDTRAGNQYKGLNVNYTTSNYTYQHRLSATYNTGYMGKSGVAISLSLARRWANTVYEKGTSLDGWSYFFSIEKNFKNRHFISFTTFGTPQSGAVATPTIKQMQTLTNDPYYNPTWGYQNGVVRSEATRKRFTPVFILNHEAKIGDKTNLLTAVSFEFGTNRRGGLDWLSATNPLADYYRNVPSFIDDPTDSALAAHNLSSSDTARGIQWDNIIAMNRHANDTITNAYNNGTKGNTVIGNRSVYVMADQVDYTKKFNFNTTLNHSFSDHVALTAGATYQVNRTEHYKELTDLLGGDFYLDVNKFAVLDFPTNPIAQYNDTARPNRIVRVGDKYDYDYLSTYHKGGVWLQPYFKFNKVDFFIGLKGDYSYFFRTGLVTNGLFPAASFGDSKKLSFFNYAAKIGAAYKINGRNTLFVNGIIETLPPSLRNSFLSVRTRNDVVPGLESSSQGSVELGYEYKSPKIHVKMTGYFTQTWNETQTVTFFHDDYRSNVNYTTTGIATRHFGYEFGADFKVYKGFSINAVSAMGSFKYSDDAVSTITKDNSAAVLQANQKTYLKGFNIGGTPQTANSLGLRYEGKQHWSVGVNANYFDFMWVTINPIRRTQDAIDLVDYGSAKFHEIFDQERLKGQFTFDLQANYSLQLNHGGKNKYMLLFNGSLTNFTNNTNFVNNAYEQLRFDYNEKDVNRYATRYHYYHGIGYRFSIAFQIR